MSSNKQKSANTDSRISELDLHLFGEGNHHHLADKFGAHPVVENGKAATQFAVWAPNATGASVCGDFNDWSVDKHEMQPLGSSGVWCLTTTDAGPGAKYKFALRTHGGQVRFKCDPFAFAAEVRPGTCSVVTDCAPFAWQDDDWMQQRAERDPLTAPVNIYEVHPGSWHRHPTGEGFYTYDELADALLPYVTEMGYTHIELFGVMEHPLDASWGYQVTGYFAPTARHGSPEAFAHFVDRAHQAGIGVLIDWVPAHFPSDAHGLAEFDGTHLYEHADPRQGMHLEWGTRVFNYGRNEVRNFLIASALYWIERFHIDGLRVDAVASMLYLDYNRDDGHWLPNQHGGRENLEAVAFLRQLNPTLYRYHPGVLSIAEESTDFPMVTRPPEDGGLGFNLKWNMGWMNDTLRYTELDPLFRRDNGNLLTFSMMYAYSENFVLPISHDEVVHGKRSLLHKMPGDDWRQRAGHRLYIAYMMGHPGKKLLFMGCEFGQRREWSEARELDWALLDHADHRQLRQWCLQLNHLYLDNPALYASDFDPAGFTWINCNDTDSSVFSFFRSDPQDADASPLLFILNFTPVPRPGYVVGCPRAGTWQIELNSDAQEFGGSGNSDVSEIQSVAKPANGQPHRLQLDLPPLAALVLKVSK